MRLLPLEQYDNYFTGYFFGLYFYFTICLKNGQIGFWPVAPARSLKCFQKATPDTAKTVPGFVLAFGFTRLDKYVYLTDILIEQF